MSPRHRPSAWSLGVALLLLLAGRSAPAQCDQYEVQKLTADDAMNPSGSGAALAADGAWAVVGRDASQSAFFLHHDGNSWSVSQQLLVTGIGSSKYFPTSAALDGDLAVIGTSYINLFGAGWGAAYVFRRTGSTWSQEQKLVSSDLSSNDQFGFSVDVEGGRVIVGAPGKTEAVPDGGAAYVFKYDGIQWTQEAKLTGTSTANQLRFGEAVAIDGAVAAVGEPEGADSLADGGVAHVFQWGGTSWSPGQLLTSSEGLADDRFGGALSLDGPWLAIGAPRSDAVSTRGGRVHVYGSSGGSWSEAALLKSFGNQSLAAFGYALDLDGDRLAVGANGSGAVYLFENDTSWSQTARMLASDAGYGSSLGEQVALSDTEVLAAIRLDPPIYAFDGVGDAPPPYVTEEQKLFASSGAYGDGFGGGLAMDGARAVVGASAADVGFSLSGSIFTYDLVGDTWGNETRIDGTQTHAFFGSYVVMQGDTLVVSEKGYADGRAHVFHRVGPAWQPSQILQPADLYYYEEFGGPIDLSDDRMIIAALGWPGPNGGPGRAYIYRRTGLVWSVESKLLAPPGTAYPDRFGTGVALEGDLAVVSNYAATVGGVAYAGRVHVYRRTGLLWQQEAVLTAPVAEANGRFGGAVEIVDGDLFVGSGGAAATPGSGTGAVFVLRKVAGQWTFLQTIRSGVTDTTSFGSRLEVDGDGMLTTTSSPGCGTSQVHHLRHNGTSWVPVQRLSHSAISTVDSFGAGLAISGNRALIGAPEDGGKGSVNAYTLPPLGLFTSPEPVEANQTLTFEVDGGRSVEPGILFITGVDVTSALIPLSSFQFDAEGQWSLAIPVPSHPALPGLAVHFQAYAAGPYGELLSSNERTVSFD